MVQRRSALQFSENLAWGLPKMPKFSDLSLRNLPVPEKGQITYHDEGSPLAVRVSQGGRKTFIVFIDGKRHTIGPFSLGIITLAEARDAARRLKAERYLGRIIPAAVGVAQARQEYLAQITVRDNTRRYYTRVLDGLTQTKLSEISPRDIHRILDPLTPTSCNQALASLRAFFRWCQRRHYIEKNPCELVVARKTQSRSRVLSDDEIARIWKACSQRGEDGAPSDEVEVARQVSYPKGKMLEQSQPVLSPSLPTNFARIVQLLILTGMRRNEAASIQKSWLSLSSTSSSSFQSHSYSALPQDSPSRNCSTDLWTLTIPASVSKNGKELTIPVGALTVSVLKSAMQTASTPFLFPAPGGSGKSFCSWKGNKRLLDKIVGLAEPYNLHDLRRSYAVNLQRLGVKLETIESLLGHISGSRSGIVGVYQRYDFQKEARQAVELYETHLRKILNEP